jgi:hypothetical protein
MNNQIHAYEPLTSENAALVLVDHQVGLMTGVRDISTGELKHNVLSLAKPPSYTSCRSSSPPLHAIACVTAVAKGLDAYVAVDACGTFSRTKREVGLLRMLQAGVVITDYASLMVEILKDNSRPDAGAIYGAIDIP